MAMTKLNFESNPNIGLFAFATDKFCMASRFIRNKDARIIGDMLNVPVYRMSVLQTGFLGLFAAGNSRGVVVSDKLYAEEISEMRKNVPVLALEAKPTAIGNLMLVNDRGCIISEELRNHANEIQNFLGVETRVGTVAGMDLVGSLAVANGKGCLAHKAVTESEKKLIEQTLGVTLAVGSVNYGNQWIRSGLIANSQGFAAGDHTSGPELGLISETLGFV